MFNFKQGFALADQQTAYIARYVSGDKVSSKEMSDMEQNLWVASASTMAPGNLVIRQWALIDLFKGTPKHKDSIAQQLDILSYKNNGKYRLHAEGYSYFVYTMDILSYWIKKFDVGLNIIDIKNIIDKVQQGFIATSYSRKGVWFPAPYGDLREIPLAQELQVSHEVKTCTIANVTLENKDNVMRYIVKGRPLGCNTHIPKNDYSMNIMGERPVGFNFYIGYDKKYKNSFEEYLDTFNPKRLASILFR